MASLNHVGFNLISPGPQKAGGLETYARELITAIGRARPELKMTGFMNAHTYEKFHQDPWSDRLQPVRLSVNPDNRAYRIIYEQLWLGKKTRKAGIDLLHSVANTGPIRAPTAHVISLHDVIWLHQKADLAPITRMSLGVLVPHMANGATRIITGTEGAKKDIISNLNVVPDKIDVIYHGMGKEHIGNVKQEVELRRDLGLGNGPIILHVSGKRRYKNLTRLVEALSLLEDLSGVLLVLPGPSEFAYERELRMKVSKLGLDDRVKFFGWLETPELEGLYRAAKCFAFPSLIEGFGLPVLEAMKRGLPVTCSNSSPMPEVCGDAALYFDPDDPVSIAGTIRQVMCNDKLQMRLIQSGYERVASFTWDNAAQKTLGVYECALSIYRASTG